MRHTDRSPDTADPAASAQGARARARGSPEVDRMDSIGRFASRVAHDFNNFLMVIRSESELAALDLPDDHPAREALTNVCLAVDRATTFTSHLHGLNSRADEDGGVINLNALVEVVGKMVPREPVPISVVTECAAGALWVRGDREKVLIVARHVVTNACEAMPSGGNLRIEARTIQLDEARAMTYGVAPGSFGVLTVTDTGEGLSQEVRARLFEPFVTTKPPKAQLGLGLATSWATVRRAGGFLDVESQPDHGTSVQIHLPCATAQSADGVSASRRSTGSEQGPGEAPWRTSS